MNPAEDYIIKQPEPFRSILLHLQIIIEQVIPSAEMLFKYKIPFYYIDGKRPLCYLNCTNGYVDLGFWNAAHLSKHTTFMISDGRKHMKSFRYFSIADIDETVLSEVLVEAYSLRDKKFYN